MDDWSNINPDMQGGGTPPNNNQNEDQDVKPVKLSKGKVAAVIVALMVVAIILIMTVQSCSIQREVNNSSVSPTPQVTITEASQESGNGGGNDGNFSENTSDSGVSSGSRDQNSNSAVTVTPSLEEENSYEEEGDSRVDSETEEVPEQVVENDSEGLREVAEPILGDVYETTAMVSSKKVYNFNDESYAYAITLVLLTGENETTTVDYLCPRKTFDALSTADTVTVQYQMDSNGVVSISTVSR